MVKLDCTSTKEDTRETYNKLIEELGSPPHTVVKVRDEPVSEPSHIDKPPKEHELMIEEDVARSMQRELMSGNQMCAIQTEEAGITNEDL